MNGRELGDIRRVSVGEVAVATTSDGGHPPEFYAERIVNGLIHVAETAPPVIRVQAIAYQNAMHGLVLGGIRDAIRSSQTTVIARLKLAGMNEAAALVAELQKR